MARNNLIFVTYNVKSLFELNRRIELIIILNYNKVDICFVQETHLCVNSRVSFENCILIRDISGQDTAIVIKKYIKFTQIYIPDLKFLNCFITINLSFNSEVKRFLLDSIYVPTNF